jgi:hypothetical protein
MTLIVMTAQRCGLRRGRAIGGCNTVPVQWAVPAGAPDAIPSRDLGAEPHGGRGTGAVGNIVGNASGPRGPSPQ